MEYLFTHNVAYGGVRDLTTCRSYWIDTVTHEFTIYNSYRYDTLKPDAKKDWIEF